MINVVDSKFLLTAGNIQYIFQVIPTGHLEHLHFGEVVANENNLVQIAESLKNKKEFAGGTTASYSESNINLVLEDINLEISSLGKGDLRQPMFELISSEGISTTDFKYVSHEIIEGCVNATTLPGAYDDASSAMTLLVNMSDDYTGAALKLFYTVFPNCSVITKRAEIIAGNMGIKIKRALSNQIDLPGQGYKFTHFTGNWAREMNKNSVVINSGSFVNQCVSGMSGNRANPFVMVSEADASEDFGRVYGFNLIYSGSHIESLECSTFGTTRFLQGIHPLGFEYALAPGETFEVPEAVMSFSGSGYNGLSANMHSFIRNNIVRGEWKSKRRPILLNSWEACYFNISRDKLLKLAKAGKDAGIELFVLDDGWFGERDDDTTSLGDWDENTKKIHGGIGGLCNDIHAMDMLFGLWVEPEMVSPKSKLYEAHPGWAVGVPGKEQSLGRHQMLLDLANVEVQDYIIESMTKVFSYGPIDYIKWDMNRNFSDLYFPSLPADRQGEGVYRYYQGFYRIMRELTARFPHILFEGCASGGNRFDLGILSFFPQIWGSDNTDAGCRETIQEGLSYGYPQSVYTAHVSACPNHQTLRTTSLDTRFAVACAASFGYELNMCELPSEDLEEIKSQVQVYKKWAELLQFGKLYRYSYGNEHTWTIVSDDKESAVIVAYHSLAVPNCSLRALCARGLDPEAEYSVINRDGKINIKEFGDLINQISPIHLKKDGFVVNLISKFYKLNTEHIDFKATGSALMSGSVLMNQDFGGTGFGGNTGLYKDFQAKVYFLERDC